MTQTTITDATMMQPILGTAQNTPKVSVAASSVPLGISSSGKWRIWNDMNEEEQNRSLQEASEYVKKYGSLIGRNPSKKHNKHLCKTQLFGTGGEHMLCDPPPPKPCYFLSSGINKDPSFDIALADKWGCRGVGLDPTIDHNSHLHPSVTFHNVGLNTVGANEEKMTKLGGDDWWYSSVPGAIKFFGMDYVDIIKLDCEGCEIAFTRDILAEDPKFLERVGQITIETHATKAWINTTEQLYYFALIFPLLEEAGFQMVWSSVFGCNMRHERYKCRQELLDWGFACGLGPKRMSSNSCHDFLFVREHRRGMTK